VCDDAPGFQVLMTAVLEEAGVQVIGQGATWAEAVGLIACAPDIVVCDLWMPLFDDEALGRIRKGCPDATVAVVTALTLVDAAEKVAMSGVDLLLSKSAPPAELAEMIAAHAREKRGAPG
jgi:DNA-binding NarL/FixJ family response regulator